jgi:hypothetical protein
VGDPIPDDEARRWWPERYTTKKVRASRLASLKGPQTALESAGAENPAQPCPPNQDSIWRDIFFHPTHPIQTLSTGREQGRRLGACLAAWPTVSDCPPLRRLHTTRKRSIGNTATRSAPYMWCAAGIYP